MSQHVAPPLLPQFAHHRAVCADGVFQVDELSRKARVKDTKKLALDDIPSAIILSRQVRAPLSVPTHQSAPTS